MSINIMKKLNNGYTAIPTLVTMQFTLPKPPALVPGGPNYRVFFWPAFQGAYLKSDGTYPGHIIQPVVASENWSQPTSNLKAHSDGLYFTGCNVSNISRPNEAWYHGTWSAMDYDNGLQMLEGDHVHLWVRLKNQSRISKDILYPLNGDYEYESGIRVIRNGQLVGTPRVETLHSSYPLLNVVLSKEDLGGGSLVPRITADVNIEFSDYGAWPGDDVTYFKIATPAGATIGEYTVWGEPLDHLTHQSAGNFTYIMP